MKTSLSIRKSPVPMALALTASSLLFLCSCDKSRTDGFVEPPSAEAAKVSLSAEPEPVARMLSELPLSLSQVREVWDGVNESSSNGYDEEYTFGDLLSFSGGGTTEPLAAMLSSYAGKAVPTRSSCFLEELKASGLQIYWPYSDNWDFRSMPVITFCPEEVVELNVGFSRKELPDGTWTVEEIMVDEEYAKAHPVWVINRNDDSGSMTPQMLEKLAPKVLATRSSSAFKTLKLKEFKAHRQYDSWLAGGSEFFIKVGSLKAFTADVVSDLSRYDPEITDLMIKVKRSQVGKAVRYNTILVSEWSGQLSECAFLIHEDDGGKMTTWKSSGTVKIKSKSYGFEVEIP
ncbi:MAG: hypothetical protein IK145_00025, partial [Bacteroidales bacterium]|nr:hypothetical protein [Bacteroidales bacterium]